MKLSTSPTSARMGMLWSVLKSLLIVTATYTLAIAGMHFGLGGPENLPEGSLVKSDGDASLGLVLIFTASHAVLPVFFYAFFLWLIPRDGRVGGYITLFIYLHMGLWFGIPIIGLALISGWLNLIWAVVHVALARPGRRTFTFIEYGSTSLALFLFLTAYGEGPFFPSGLFLAVAQAAMLTIVDIVGERVLVPPDVREPSDERKQTPPTT
jgi:hypothetical protein